MSSHSGRRSQMGGVKYKYAVTATSLLIVLLAGCSYSEAFLLSDRSISISISISNGRHRLHRRTHGLSQSLLLSLRAVAKDKKLKNDNKLKDKTEIETPESSGYHLGVFPYLSTPSQATSASASSNGTSTSTLSVDPQQRSTGMNATNSNSTKTTNVDVDVDSETVTEKALNLNSTTAKEDFNTTSKTDALFFTQKSSTSIIKRASTSASTLVVDRPELSKSSTNTATTANTATAVNTTGKSNSQDSKVEESWQDKYLNRFRYDKSKSKGTTASTRTSKKPSTSLVSKMQANVNVKGALGKERKESTPLMAGRNPSDPLTVQDLESFLMTSGFVRRSELEESQKAQQARSSANDLPGNGVGSSVGSATQKTVSGVALPSPSVISYENVKWGAAVSAGFLGMLIGLSILPNLWLMGTLAGFLYGWEIGKKLPETLPTTRNALNNMIVNLGRNLAKGCLTVYDAANAIFFMYKTGELSYSYYKRFSVLDKRFKIQNKVDAWNARFVEGKADFEKWEQQNEVGRKALATMRTIWLVEERSLKRGLKKRRQSKYRVIQFFNDAAFWTGRLCRSILKLLTGGGSSELTEFLKGLRVDMSESRMNEISVRFGAAVAALAFVSVTGALFSISPLFLCGLAILVGIIWPTWVSEFYDRTSRFLEDTRARGRGDDPKSNVFSDLTGRYDKSRFHYYVTMDGKKRYYRTGKPVFSGGGTEAATKRKAAKKWPWQSS